MNEFLLTKIDSTNQAAKESKLAISKQSKTKQGRAV